MGQHTVAHPLSEDQRRQGLVIALERRQRRARLLHDIKAGRHTIGDVLQLAQTDPVAASTLTRDALLAWPGVGEIGAERIMQSYAGQLPYYVYVQMDVVEVTSPGDYITFTPGLDAWISDEEFAQQLIIFPAYGSTDNGPLCAGGTTLRTPEGSGLAVGASALSCMVFTAPEGQEVTKVSYDGKFFDAEAPYDQEPIYWSA